jgi:CheY-like chemotaxis protein
VVDDDPVIRASLAETLELAGYQVRQAKDGSEALEAMARWQPDLVLLDMRMPVMDGWTFVRELRERGFAPKMAVMTAATDASRWAGEVGADAYLAKPFGIADVLRVMDRLCPPGP